MLVAGAFLDDGPRDSCSRACLGRPLVAIGGSNTAPSHCRRDSSSARPFGLAFSQTADLLAIGVLARLIRHGIKRWNQRWCQDREGGWRNGSPTHGRCQPAAVIASEAEAMAADLVPVGSKQKGVVDNFTPIGLARSVAVRRVAMLSDSRRRPCHPSFRDGGLDEIDQRDVASSTAFAGPADTALRPFGAGHLIDVATLSAGDVVEVRPLFASVVRIPMGALSSGWRTLFSTTAAHGHGGSLPRWSMNMRLQQVVEVAALSHLLEGLPKKVIRPSNLMTVDSGIGFTAVWVTLICDTNPIGHGGFQGRGLADGFRGARELLLQNS